MIGLTGAVRVMVATKPVDFRKGAEGLAALVREQMRADPFSGAVYVFRAKRADRVKLIYWDGTGVCLFAKRLEDGKFRWPSVQDGVMRLSAAELSACWKGSIGGEFTRRERYRRRCSRDDCGTVNQRVETLATRRGHDLIRVMTESADSLPDDPGTLKAMLIAERVQTERLRQIIKELQRHRFGRRAETLPEDQMLLGLEEVEQVAASCGGQERGSRSGERASRPPSVA